MIIEAAFVTSAAGAEDFPRDGLRQVALVGRSNVGKSSVINRLVGQRIARTSAAPGKTRLANFYRVRRGTAPPFYLVDLPGYGYARGGGGAAREFDDLTRAYFGQIGQKGRIGQIGRKGQMGENPSDLSLLSDPSDPSLPSVLLLVDARHPGLESDRQAWAWLQNAVNGRVEIVATKIDKLARGERIRALRELESVFEHPALPCSAATGEGMEDLWKQIDSRQPNSSSRSPRGSSNRHPPRKATARPHQKSSNASTSRR